MERTVAAIKLNPKAVMRLLAIKNAGSERVPSIPRNIRPTDNIRCALAANGQNRISVFIDHKKENKTAGAKLVTAKKVAKVTKSVSSNSRPFYGYQRMAKCPLVKNQQIRSCTQVFFKVRAHNQNMTTKARAHADWKSFGYLSSRVTTRRQFLRRTDLCRSCRAFDTASYRAKLGRCDPVAARCMI